MKTRTLLTIILALTFSILPAAVHAEYEVHLLCDYASVGNPPNEGYDFMVWLPVVERHF